MSVVLSTPFTPPAPAYNEVHLDYLAVSLEKTQYAKTQVQARVRLYYRQPDGTKMFSPEIREIAIPDAEAWATQLAQQGDLRGVQAAQHITEMVALLVEMQTDLGAASAV